jgi:hypothetical protein
MRLTSVIGAPRLTPASDVSALFDWAVHVIAATRIAEITINFRKCPPFLTVHNAMKQLSFGSSSRVVSDTGPKG